MIVEEADEYLEHCTAITSRRSSSPRPPAPTPASSASPPSLRASSTPSPASASPARRTSLTTDAEQLVHRLRRYTNLPIAVGFGISSPEHVAAVGEFADAAVIGSALVATIEQAGPQRAPGSIARFINGLARLRSGTRRAGPLTSLLVYATDCGFSRLGVCARL